MSIYPVAFRQFNTYKIPNIVSSQSNEPCEMVSAFCKTFSLPNDNRNYSDFDENLAQKIASYKEKSVKPVIDMLQNASDEKNITAGLFLLNRIIDAGAKNVSETYPVISKFNYNESHNVQVMLAGIYRKTQVPDGFGPLMTMFLKNAQNPTQKPFDPNEEIGGAILEYLRNKSAFNIYSDFINK